MQLPSSFSSVIDYLSQLPQQKIAKVISALLLGYIAYVLAQITWLITPSGQYQTSANVSMKIATQSAKTSTISLSNLKSLNLFGLYTDQVEHVALVAGESVPETRLNLPPRTER